MIFDAPEPALYVHTDSSVFVRSTAPLPLVGLLAALTLSMGSVSPARAQFLTAEAATVVTATGRVSVIRNETLWALFPDQSVRVGETVVTEEDGFAELLIGDGSQFLVFPNSRVVFRRNPGSLRDLVDVFVGRVKFHIQRLTGGEPRYRIFTPTAVISVRGTSFDVDVDPNETTLIAVEDGIVGVTHRLLPSNSEITVGAGESLVVYRDAPLAQAGVNKVKAVRIASDVARTVASIWSRLGGRTSSGGGPAPPSGPPSGPSGGGLPGDEQAPEPPPPPAPADP